MNIICYKFKNGICDESKIEILDYIKDNITSKPTEVTEIIDNMFEYTVTMQTVDNNKVLVMVPVDTNLCIFKRDKDIVKIVIEPVCTNILYDITTLPVLDNRENIKDTVGTSILPTTVTDDTSESDKYYISLRYDISDDYFEKSITLQVYPVEGLNNLYRYVCDIENVDQSEDIQNLLMSGRYNNVTLYRNDYIQTSCKIDGYPLVFNEFNCLKFDILFDQGCNIFFHQDQVDNNVKVLPWDEDRYYFFNMMILFEDVEKIEQELKKLYDIGKFGNLAAVEYNIINSFYTTFQSLLVEHNTSNCIKLSLDVDSKTKYQHRLVGYMLSDIINKDYYNAILVTIMLQECVKTKQWSFKYSFINKLTNECENDFIVELGNNNIYKNY